MNSVLPRTLALSVTALVLCAGCSGTTASTQVTATETSQASGVTSAATSVPTSTSTPPPTSTVVPEPSPASSTAPPSTIAPSGTPPNHPDPTTGATATPDVPAEPTDLVTGLEAPWSVAFVGSTALVSLRDSGRIVEVVGDTIRDVGVVDGVVHRGEGGLLGLAVLPQAQPYLYAYYTSENDNRVVRYPLTGAPGSFGLGDADPVFSGIPKANIHNGGRIAFGPDGLLYVTAGDAGTRPNAQDPNSLSGKILRLKPDGSVPDDNPIAGNPMYSMGHRNPQGIGWQADGTMWAAEFGQDTWDELNKITKGANYGWPEVEGIAGDSRFTDPVAQWHPVDASPSGLAVVGDTVYIAALRGQRLIKVPLGDPEQASAQLVGQFGRLRDVLTGPDGALWIVTNNTDGRGTPRDRDDRIVRLAAP